MLRTTTRGRRLAVAVVTLAMGALAACEPMPHTTVSVRATPGAGADLVLLSGNARYVVLTATAAGPVVPGAGNWRLDRSTGDAVALPAGRPIRISSDGTRVLLELNGGASYTFWDDGVSAPSVGVLSPDLSARAFVGSDGTVQTQDVATGVTRPVEVGLPRPPGTTARASQVSDDGDTVVYLFGSTIRVVDLAAGDSFDLTSVGGGDVTEGVLLAGSGTALARTVDEVYCTFDGCEVLQSTIDLIEIPTGTVLAHHENLTNEVPAFTRIADNGRVVWSYRERTITDDAGAPQCPAAPFFVTCVVASSLVEVTAGGVRVDDAGPGHAHDLSVSDNGRFAALTKEQPGYAGYMPMLPVGVVDRLSSGDRWEFLGGAPATAVNGRISNDGTVISTTSEDGGWFDFEA
jgi:hypothetical protein